MMSVCDAGREIAGPSMYIALTHTQQHLTHNSTFTVNNFNPQSYCNSHTCPVNSGNNCAKLQSTMSNCKKKHHICCHGTGNNESCQVKERNVSSCEEPPFSICFHYYFHTVGVLWILLPINVSGKCNKSHVLILSVWFHQASYTLRK